MQLVSRTEFIPNRASCIVTDGVVHQLNDAW
jgi:hypothetical protein